jgi:hypothetical protein
MKSSVRKWELIGIVVISLLGSALHFAFEWTGGWEPIGIIAAVNESVFEHLKLTYWSTLVYAAITYGFLKKTSNNFIIAKTASLYVMPVAIIILFYSYTAITGTENLIVDIVIFVVAIALGQLTSYKILTTSQLSRSLHWLALAFLIILAAIYGVFTYFPPHVPLFLDPVSGTYGISWHSL